MSRSFDRLIEFFSMEQREKEKKVEEIFQETLEFFKYFKHVQSQGTDEEKKSVQQKLTLLQDKFKQEAEKTLSDVKLSEDQVVEITGEKKHFSEEQWAFLDNIKNVLNEQKESLTQENRQLKRSSLDKLKKGKKTKTRVGSKRWLKS